MRIYQTTTLVVPDGSGPLPTRSVAWRWETNVGVVVPVAVVTQSGAPFDLTGATGLLSFWASELDVVPFLSVALAPALDPTTGLGTLTVPALSLLAGDYAVGATLTKAGASDTVLKLGRVQIFRRAA